MHSLGCERKDGEEMQTYLRNSYKTEYTKVAEVSRTCLGNQQWEKTPRTGLGEDGGGANWQLEMADFWGTE